MVWGCAEEPGTSVAGLRYWGPDLSDKALQHPSALGAEARVDLDELADDIPTPLPSHGRPTVDLSPRPKTPLLRPRPGTRKKSPPAAPRRSQQMAAQPDLAAAAAPAAAPMADEGRAYAAAAAPVPAP